MGCVGLKYEVTAVEVTWAKEICLGRFFPFLRTLNGYFVTEGLSKQFFSNAWLEIIRKIALYFHCGILRLDCIAMPQNVNILDIWSEFSVHYSDTPQD